MSELVTLSTNETETIYGTFAGAKSYLGIMTGDAYATWRGLSDDDKKRTLATARRYLDEQSWIDTADTFTERDAIADPNDGARFLFQRASYELAALIAVDDSITSAVDAGSNIKSMGAGSGRLEFFAPTKPGAGATKLPTIVQRLIGKYLAATQGATSVTSYSATGSDTNPFNDDSDMDRSEPF